MAALTSIALGVAAAAGVAGTVVSINAQKKAARAQNAALRKQETTAREAAAKQATRSDTGASVKLGTDDLNKVRSATGGTGRSNRSGAVSGSVGGVKASKRLGL